MALGRTVPMIVNGELVYVPAPRPASSGGGSGGGGRGGFRRPGGSDDEDTVARAQDSSDEEGDDLLREQVFGDKKAENAFAIAKSGILSKFTRLRIFLFGLWLVGLWLVGEWWHPYIIVSGILVLFLSLDRRAGPGMSPWSVFNDGFEVMPGTLTAAQLDAELRHNLPGRNSGAQTPGHDGDDEAEEGGEDDADAEAEEERQIALALELSRREAEEARRRRGR